MAKVRDNALPLPSWKSRIRLYLSKNQAPLRCLAWCGLLLLGYAYVSGVLCGRPNPFLSGRGGIGELAKLMLSAPILFYLGPNRNFLRGYQSLRGFLLRDVLFYGLVFFIGLHFFHLQSIPSINYSLTPYDLSRMPTTGRLVFGLGALAIAALGAYHAFLAKRQGILLRYGTSVFLAIGLLVTITFLLRHSHYVHIHHYFLAGFFIPWTRFRNPLSMLCQALCAAVYTEGISEWSMAALWYSFH
jgi:hypothetical protein